MSLILNIETATTVCSVAVSDKEKTLASREVNNGYTHAENLHVFMKEVLSEANIKPQELSAVAVSKGPGSYTGLRIGVSAAKGIAYALNIPLLSVDTLQIMAQIAQQNVKKTGLYIPMLDARRMEVYTATYNELGEEISTVSAVIVSEESVLQFKCNSPLYFFGDGMPKCKSLLEILPGSIFIENIVPSAVFMPSISYKKFQQQQFENVAYFEPFYLKEFYLRSEKK